MIINTCLSHLIVSFWKAGTIPLTPCLFRSLYPAQSQCYTTINMNRLLVITRGSSVLPLRASVKWPSHKLYLSPAQGTQGNRTVCGIAQGVSSHSWQISTPIVRTLHTAWSFVAYPYSCLNSHTASKVGRRGVDSEVMCGPGFLEGICPTQACTLSMG